MIQDLHEIRMTRVRLGITQSELAKQSGVSQSLIAKIESGRIDPAFTKVGKIMDALALLTKQKEMPLKSVMVTKLISVGPELRLQDAISKMKRFGISQMPVIEEGACVGVLSERTILESMTGNRPHHRVRDVMSDAPPQLPLDAGVSAASKLLAYYSLILVSEKGKIKGLVTRSDILQKAFH